MADINNLIDSMIADGEIGGQRDQAKRDIKTSIKRGSSFNPDQAAENDRLARDTGFAVDYIERNKDSVKRDRFVNQLPIDGLLSDAPVTARKLADPEFAKQAHDDIDGLARIEKAVRLNPEEEIKRQWGAYGANAERRSSDLYGVSKQAGYRGDAKADIQRGADMARSFLGSPISYVGSAIDGVGSLIDIVTRAPIAGLDKILPEGANKYLYLDKDSPEWIKQFAKFSMISPSTTMYGESIKDVGKSVSPPAERQNLMTDIAGGVGQVGAQIAMSFIAPWSSFGMMAGAGADEQVQRQKEQGVYGESISTDMAVLAGAGLEGALEKAGLDALINRLPPKVKRGMFRYMADLATAGGIELVEEALAAAGQNVIEYANYNPNAEIFDGVEREALAGGGTGVVVRAILMALPNSRIRIRSEAETAKIAETFAAVKDSKLNGRNKDLVKAYLQELAEDTGSDSIYIDAEGVEALFQTVDDQSVIQSPIMTQIADQFIDAKQSGEKIRIPISEIPELVDQGIADSLMPFMTADADSLSAAYALDEEIQLSVAELRESMLDDAQGRSDIYEDIRGQELARGQSNKNAEDRAILVNAHYNAMAKRDGKGRTAEQLYKEFNPSYKNEVSDALKAKGRLINEIDVQLNRLRNGDIPSDDQIFGDSLLKFIRKAGGIIDEGGELLARDLKSLIRNKTGRTIDDMAEQAFEAGYIPERDPNLLFDLIDDEARGNKTYVLGEENADLQSQAASLNQLDDLLMEMGLDLAELTNDQIIEIIQGEVDDQGALTQANINGYEGVDVGEAKEWNRAVAKGLDMSLEARMDRAQAMGFDVENVFYHGTRRDFDGFEASNPRGAIGNKSGVYFTRDRSVAEEYAMDDDGAIDSKSRVIEAYLKDPQLIENSYSGDEFLVTDPASIRSINAAFDPDYSDSSNLLAQKADEPKNLAVVHNITAEGVIAANELGGLAAPSIATIRSDRSDFDNFGEITLVADNSLLQSPKARTFDADVYSPRQPRASYKINAKAFRSLEDKFPSGITGLSGVDINSLESRGVEVLEGSTEFQFYYLESIGKAPKPKKKKVNKHVAAAAKMGVIDVRDGNFQALADKYYRELVAEAAAKSDMPESEFEGLYFNDAGVVDVQALFDFQGKAASHAHSGGIDNAALKADIAKKMRVKKTASDFQQFAKDTFNSISDGEVLFKGYTNSGDRSYSPYTMANVLKEMTKTIRGGEASFYGAGSVRSAYANELNTLAKVKAKRDSIISQGDFEVIKEESNSVFSDALDRLKPFYKFDADSFNYMDDAGQAIMEGPKGLREAFNVNDEMMAIVRDLTDYLRNMPTAYFETKIGRAVGFGEFDTAVVPKGVRKDALKVLKDSGLKIRYYDPSGNGTTRQEAIQAQSRLLFQSDDRAKQKKDNVDYRGKFNPDTYEITFSKKENFSTFVHETGHLFLQNMMNMAVDSPEIQADMDVLNKWWADNGAVTFTERHEMFASGFEQYAMEGKAPSAELQSVFGRFRVFIVDVYRRLSSNPFKSNSMKGVELSDEVRDVMGRMLATQDEIDAAKDANLYGPSIMESVGLTPEQANEIQVMMNAAEDEAYQELAAEVMAEYRRETKDWWRDAKKKMRDDVAAEVASQRVYVLRDALNGGNDVEAPKLNRAMVKAELGTGRDNKAYNKVSKMLSNDGVSPSALAYKFGYQDGNELVYDLINSMSKKERTDYINAEADARMLSLYGDMLNDGSMAQAAQGAVHNDKMADVLIKELALLDGRAGKKITPRSVFKAAAEQRINETPVIQIRPSQYLASEKRSRSNAMRLAAKGDFKGASNEMRKATYQHFMFKEATRAVDDSEALRKLGKSMTKGARLATIKKAGDHYIQQIDGILGSIELKVVSGKAIARRRSMADFIEAQMSSAGMGNPMAQDSELDDVEKAAREASDRDDAQSMSPSFGLTDSMLTEAETVNYRELTPLEQIEIKDMLNSTYHLAKLKTKLLTNQDKRTLAEHIDDLEQALKENAIKGKANKRGTSIDKAERRKRFLAEMYDGSRTPTSLIRMFDGFDESGVAWKLIGKPLQEAATEETKLMDEANKKLEALFSVYKAAELKKFNTKIPNEAWSKNDILSLFLNFGNAEGRDRVLNGMKLNEAEVYRLFDAYLDKRDVDFAKKAWKLIGSYKKQSFDLHKDLFGFTPTEVEPLPIQTKFGLVDGGYYSIVYDTAKSARAEQNSIASDNEPFGRSVAVKVSLGSNKARIATVDRELNTDLTQVIFGHIGKVIHSISHDRALYDVGRLLASDEIKNAINDGYGEHVYKSLVDVVREVKFGKERVNDAFDRTMVWMRNNATFALLGASLRTIVLQPFGVTNSFVRLRLAGIPKGKLIHQYSKLMGSMPSKAKEVRAKSQYMSQREQVMNVAISRISQRIKQNSKLDEVKNWTMIPMQKAQFFSVDLPTWLVSYEHSISQGIGEADAIAMADQMVRDAQGGGSLIDTATSMQGNAWKKLFTNFLSYMMTTFTLQDQNYKQFKKGDIGAIDFAVNTLSLVMMPAILTALLNDFVAGEDDEQPWWDRLWREQLSFIMGSNIITAQFSGVVNGFDYSGAQGTAIIRQAGSLYKQLSQGDLDEGMVKASIATFGLAYGLPIAQLNRSIGGFNQAMADDDGALETIKKIGFGPERD